VVAPYTVGLLVPLVLFLGGCSSGSPDGGERPASTSASVSTHSPTADSTSVPTADPTERARKPSGDLTAYWIPSGSTQHTAKLSLDGDRGTALVYVMVSGTGMARITEDLDLERSDDLWRYRGSNPVVSGVDMKYSPDLFVLERHGDGWAVSSVCEATDPTTCYLAWSATSS
jgi:hypothetical protein